MISPQWANHFLVIASSLNIRSAPGTTSNIVGTLYYCDSNAYRISCFIGNGNKVSIYYSAK